MIIRNITSQIENALNRQAVVAILGARQVGKTTLALAIGKSRDAIYLDLEDSADRDKLTNPALFFAAHEDRLVILDEIHHMPDLFAKLRGIIDKGKRQGKGKGRFLILGSASIELMRQSETLAGRISYIDMTPLTLTEIEPRLSEREKLWLRGGFPEAFLASDDLESLEIRKDFIKTYLERDIPMFGPRVPATTMHRLWTMLAHNQGTLLNSAKLARSLEISAQSVTRYIDLLSDLLLVRRLTPFHTNVSKRLVKSPKVYIRDSGLVHALLGIQNLTTLSGHPVVGYSWEGFVIENILSALPWRSDVSFYRTSAGAEIDLVVRTNNKLIAIEIKRGLSAKPRKGFYQAIADIKPDHAFLVHAGDDRYPIDEGVEAVGVRDVMGAISVSQSFH